jgi:hypothetical protein
MGMSRNGAGVPQGLEGDNTAAEAPETATRITVALVAKAASDLKKTHERTRLSRTDIVNRALSLYEFVDAELSAGAELIVRRDGLEHLVKLL